VSHALGKVVIIDVPRLMILRPLFAHWKAVIHNVNRVSIADYEKMPWLCSIADVEVSVAEVQSDVDFADVVLIAETLPEEARLALQDWIQWMEAEASGTYICLRVFRLLHGYPLLTHFGYPPDPLWNALDDHNAFATCSCNYHITLAYAGSLSNRGAIQQDLQDNVVRRFWDMRGQPEQRPRELLWLKQVWAKAGECSHGGSFTNARREDLVSFNYGDLQVLLDNKGIEPAFPLPSSPETPLQVLQRLHDRDSDRIRHARSLQSRAPPLVDHLTLITGVYEGLGSGDELRELCFYLEDALMYKHGLYYKSRGSKSPCVLIGEGSWHLTRQGFGEIYHLNV